jgi:GT2 family glycosyltransferase
VQIFNVPGRSVGRIQALDGVFIAAKRAVVEKIRFDEQTFDGFHLYDLDFTYAAFLAGFRLGVACDLYLLHKSGGSPDQAFMQYAHRFNSKYRSHLYHSDASLIKQRKYQTGLAWVPTKAEIVDVMTPHYFQ